LMSELRDGHRMISEVHEFLFHPANVEAVMTRLGKDLRRVIPLEERVGYFFSRHEAWMEASEADRAYILAGCDPSARRRLRTNSPDHSNRCRPRELPASRDDVVEELEQALTRGEQLAASGRIARSSTE